jgi:MFS family permease
MPEPNPSPRSQRGLDWLNFFMADVETAFGPFVAAYLSTKGWAQGEIGTVLTINSGVALAIQMPAGALVDWTRRKRSVVAACIFFIAGGALTIALFPRYPTVVVAETMHGVTGGVAQIALAAIALGLVGHRTFHTRVGRNSRYDSLGNAATAAMMGVLGRFVSPRAPFFAAAGLCLPAFAVLGLVRGRDIDYARARSSEGRREPRAATWRELAQNRRLLMFAGCLFLFQFANASMLPLAAERLSAQDRFESELVTAALVVVPQLVSALIAAFVARKADQWGRRPLLIAGFAALPARSVLFALVPGPWFLVAVQVLGGMTAAVIGIMTPLVVADVTRRSGRYNVALGTVSMLSGIGATISTTAVGFVAQGLGFVVGFLALAAVGLLGLGLLLWLLPETSYEAKRED